MFTSVSIAWWPCRKAVPLQCKTAITGTYHNLYRCKGRLLEATVAPPYRINYLYMNFSKNIYSILSTVAISIVVLSSSIQANGQELVARKHGTIREQIEQSALNQKQSRVQEILDYAYKFRGVPYRHGAASPRAFDCSGFTSYVFKRFGIDLDRRSSAQIFDGRRVSRSELQPGDLVFFNGRSVNKRIGHVGIVTEVDENNKGGFKFIHAAVRTGITVSHSSESYYSKRYMGACRVVE